MNYDNTQQVVSWGTVSRCWCNLTLVTLQGKLIMWMRFSCSAESLHMLAFWLSLASRSVYSLQCSPWYANLSPTSPCDHSSSFLQDINSLEIQIYLGLGQIFEFMQMFVLGPHLILSIREYHAKLVTDSDAATTMTPIAFQEGVHVATSRSV